MSGNQSATATPRADGGIDPPPALRRTIGRFQYFALGFGTIVGSAWVVVMGDWLRVAGPAGACLAFVGGGLLMVLISAVYAELCARMPEAGGEFIFAYRIFGPRTGFIVGWFVTLFLISVAAFEAIVLPWVLQMVFPGLGGARLYALFGEDITLDAVLIGAAGIVLIAFLNYRDVRLAVRFQSVITYGFLAIAVVVLIAAAGSGDVTNLQPLFGSASGSPWWLGSLWIFANTAFFLNGFQAIPQAIEERAPHIGARTIASVMMGAVLIASLFYCLAVLCASMAAPWTQLSGVPLATAVAVKDVLPGGMLTKVVLLAAAFSLLKTWNAVVLMASRLLMAQARQGLLPGRLGAIHPRHATPGAAVLFVSAVSLAGMLMGRGAVLPLVNMASICLAFTYILACLGVLLLRWRQPTVSPAFRVPGGAGILIIGMLATTGMSLIALFEPLLRNNSIPLEWMLILGWGAAGALFIKVRRHGQSGLPRSSP